MQYESQKRASARYIKRNVKTFQARFYPKDKALYEYLHKQDSMNSYLLNLIAKDMENNSNK